MVESKKIAAFLIVLFVSVMVWPGCNKKNIDLTPSLPTDQNYFQTEHQFDQGVIGRS